MKLRENQIDPVRIGVEYFKSGSTEPSLIIAPTGMGKSIIIAYITKQLQGKTLVIQPSKELLEQNIGKFRALGGEATIYSASFGEKEYGQVTYATIGSIRHLGQVFKRLGYKYLIIDEADRFPRTMDSMLGEFLQGSGMRSVLGLTASPFKLQTNSYMGESYSIISMLTSRSKHGNFFKRILHVTQIQDMGEYWTPLEYKSLIFDSSSLEYNSSKSDYTDESAQKAYEDNSLEDKIIVQTSAGPRKHILVFVPSVESAQSLAGKLPNAVAVWGNMPDKEREEAIDGFRSGRYTIAVNVNVLSVGFDYPEIDCIVLARPTTSLSMYYQQIGRGVRPHLLKENCLVIDLVGNVKRFGKVEHLSFRKEKRSWKLFGEGGKQLTGVPIHQIGQTTDTRLIKSQITAKSEIKSDVILDFGKYKDKPVSSCPDWYLNWLCNEYNWKHDQEVLEKEVIRIRDLRRKKMTT